MRSWAKQEPGSSLNMGDRMVQALKVSYKAKYRSTGIIAANMISSNAE